MAMLNEFVFLSIHGRRTDVVISMPTSRIMKPMAWATFVFCAKATNMALIRV